MSAPISIDITESETILTALLRHWSTGQLKNHFIFSAASGENLKKKRRIKEMAEKEKKAIVSFNKIDEIIKYQMKGCQNQSILLFETDLEDPTPIMVTPTLSIADVFAFVRDVSHAVFDEDDYIPAAFDFAYAKAILSYFTNIKENLSDDRALLIMYQTDLLDKVIAAINPKQLFTIKTALMEEIQHRKNTILSNQKKLLNQSLEETQKLIDVFESFSSRFEGLDIQKTLDIAQRLADKDEQQLVNSIIDLKNE